MQDGLGTVGFVRMLGPFATREDAWNAARAIVEQARVEPHADCGEQDPGRRTNRIGDARREWVRGGWVVA
jgi:hypothetical protein